eukprot:jgi/Tetstr1/432158/TSEL_021615.t1
MLTLATDVACGMAHIHSHNIIHGDLKALNVLLTPSHRECIYDDAELPNLVAKVTDFGLSAKLDSAATHVSSNYCGTITHMAPETLLAGHLSKSADVYAFGILMYEFFTGKYLYKGLTIPQVSNEVIHKRKRPVFPPHVPHDIVALACECWGDPEGRPAFMDIMARLSQMMEQHRAEGLGARTVGDVRQASFSASSLPRDMSRLDPVQAMTGSAKQKQAVKRAMKKQQVKACSFRMSEASTSGDSASGSSMDDIRLMQMGPPAVVQQRIDTSARRPNKRPSRSAVALEKKASAPLDDTSLERISDL